MKVGLIGGTGGMGEGFALRWSSRHEILIGSRDAQKAKEAANSYSRTAQNFYGDKMLGSIVGDENVEIASISDVLMLSIHYEHIEDTCNQISKRLRKDCIIISPIVPMKKTEVGFVYIPVEQGRKSAAEVVASSLGSGFRIVASFHTISEARLKNLHEGLNSDTFVCGDDRDALSIVKHLVSEIAGLHHIYLGPLSIAYQAEILTPMLLNSATRNKIKNPAIKIV